jgi:hypothetical protein
MSDKTFAAAREQFGERSRPRGCPICGKKNAGCL